jgi:uncharacterized protein with HEPN domain
MSRDDAALVDVVRAGGRAVRFAAGVTREGLGEDDLTSSAIVYQLLVVGEATRRLSAEFRARHSDVPWGDIVGMRNRLFHNYDDVDFE